MRGHVFRWFEIATLFLFSLIAIPIGANSQANGQEPPNRQAPNIPRFSAEVSKVHLPVVVLNRADRSSIYFKVFERRGNRGQFVEQKIERTEWAGRLPIRAGILIDTSGSVGSSRQFRYQKDIAAELIRLIFRPLLKEEREDKVFLADFYYEASDANPEEGIHRIRLDWSNNIGSLVKTVVALRPGGWSPIFGGISRSTSKFLDEIRGDYSTFLLVISDGYDQMPETKEARTLSMTLAEAAGLAQSAHLAIYTIGTLDTTRFPKETETFKKSADNLSRFSRLTGGRYFQSPKLSALPKIAGQILFDLENRYYIEYALNPEYKNGDQIGLKVEVGDYDSRGRWKKRSGARLLHRDGYRVVKQE